jgi:hypothetical protein
MGIRLKIVFLYWLVSIISVNYFGCTDDNIGDNTKIIQVEESLNNNIYDFNQHYDTKLPPQLISQLAGELSLPDKRYSVFPSFRNPNVIIDKLGNPFIFWGTHIPSLRPSGDEVWIDQYWYYVTGITPAPALFNYFHPQGICWDKKQGIRSITSTVDDDNNIVFYQFQDFMNIIKNDQDIWGELKMTKWDGKQFSPVSKVILPKLDKRIFDLFVRNEDVGIGIGYIIPRKELDEFIVIGGGSENYSQLEDLILGKTIDPVKGYSKSFFAIWKDGRWNNCQRISDEGKFNSGFGGLAVKKDGSIYAVSQESSDSGIATKYPASIFFNRFDGQKWEGNREISGEIPFWCEEPDITFDNQGKCHIVWNARGNDVANEHYYYRQYSDALKWGGGIEKIPLNVSGIDIKLACDTLGHPFIYWNEGGRWYTVSGMYCKIRLNDKKWSETYCLNDKCSSMARMIFDNANNIHLIWVGFNAINSGAELFYKELSYKK